MSENIFTPGPWEAGKNPCMTTILDGHEGKAIYSKESSYCIAWANAENADGDLDIETALANARVIAAAPDLLHALEHAAHTLCVTHCASCLPQGSETGMAIFFKEGCPRGCSSFDCDMAKWWEIIRKVVGIK